MVNSQSNFHSRERVEITLGNGGSKLGKWREKETEGHKNREKE